MSKKRLGRAFIKWNGKVLDTEPGAKLNIGGLQNKTGKTSHNVYYTQELMESHLECVVPLAPGDSADEYRAITDATITFECDTGQVYLIPNAWISNTIEITDGEGGKIALHFDGDPAKEL